MRRETLIGRHFSETTRDFSEGLSPSRGRVSHHSDILTHISEVLGQRNTSINRGLSGSDRHVRGVSDQAGTKHDRELGSLAIHLSRKRGELFQDLSHFVTTLTATDVDDAIRVRVLGESLRNTGLAATEGTGNSAGTTESGRIERIEHTLSREQGLSSLKLLKARSRSSNGPEVSESNLSIALGRLDDAKRFSDVEITSDGQSLESTLNSGLNHNLMVGEECVLINDTNNIATEDLLADFEVSAGHERPLLLLVKLRHLNTSGDEHGIGDISNSLERTLNTIENGVEDTCRKIRAN